MNSPSERVSLVSLYDIASGLSKPRSEFGHGHPFLSFKVVHDKIYLPKTLDSLVNASETEREKCSIERGDVFLTRTSETLDELAMSSVALCAYEAATFNGFTKRLRPNSGAVVPEYAAYYFRSGDFRRQVDSLTTMSTRASLNNEMIGRLSIILPSVEIQYAIGEILKSLDDKIELNRQTNKTLEDIARAIFKSWFVDFDPVRYKRDGKIANSDGKTPYSLNREILDLFPDKFQDSELGEIPEGWGVGEVGKVLETVGGATPSTKNTEYWENGIQHWATPKDLSGLGVPVLTRTDRKITNAGVEKISSGVLPVGTVLLSSRAPIGYLAIAQIPTAINQGFIAIRCTQQFSPYYVLHWCEVNMTLLKVGLVEPRCKRSVKKICDPCRFWFLTQRF